jgi:hypothetical protein
MMFVSGYRWQPVFCGFVTLEFRYVSMGSGGHFVPRSYILATFSSVMLRFMRQKITCRLILYESMTLLARNYAKDVVRFTGFTFASAEGSRA